MPPRPGADKRAARPPRPGPVTLLVMAGRLSPGAAVKVGELQGFTPKVAHLNSLVENYAAARVHADSYQSSLKRAAEQLRQQLMAAGFDQLAQLCGSIAMTTIRGGNQNTKMRTLRELVGSLRFQIELAIRTVIREDEEMRSKNATNEETNEA
jgi:hypothetical protein